MSIDKDPSNFYPCYCRVHGGRTINYEQASTECANDLWDREGNPVSFTNVSAEDRADMSTVPHFKKYAEFRQLKGLAHPEFWETPVLKKRRTRDEDERLLGRPAIIIVDPVPPSPINSKYRDAMYNSDLKFVEKSPKLVLQVVEANGHVREAVEYKYEPPKPNVFKRAWAKVKSFFKKAQIPEPAPTGRIIEVTRQQVIDRLRNLTSLPDLPPEFRTMINAYCYGEVGLNDIQYILRFTE